MRKTILCFIFFILLSCDKDNNNTEVLLLWDQAKLHYSLNDFDATSITLNNILVKYPDSEIIPDCLYLLHELYLNQYQKHDISLSYLNDIIDRYPNHIAAKKALFTLAYIYSNNFESYTDAFDMYNKFIEKYPEDDLVKAAEYEIKNLQPHIESIENLINN